MKIKFTAGDLAGLTGSVVITDETTLTYKLTLWSRVRLFFRKAFAR